MLRQDDDPFVIQRLISSLKGGLMWLSENHQRELQLSPSAEVLSLLRDPQRMESLITWVKRDTQARLARQAQVKATRRDLSSVRVSTEEERLGTPQEPPAQVKLTELPGVELTVEIWGLDRCSSFELPPPTLERPPKNVVEVMRPIGALGRRWAVLYGDGLPAPSDDPVVTSMSPEPEPPSAGLASTSKPAGSGFGSWLNAPTARPSRPTQAPPPSVAPAAPPPQGPLSAERVESPTQVDARPAPSDHPTTALPVLPPVAPPSDLPPIELDVQVSTAEAFSAWSAYEASLHTCHACPRSQLRAEREWVIVGGVGSRSPTVMFVESHPSRFACESGLPLAEPEVAQAFSKTLTWLGLSRHSVYTTSLMKCSVTEPSPAEWGACRVHFERELSLLQPKMIVALGTLTTQILLNKPTPLVGEWFEISGIPVIGTHHFSDAIVPQADRLKRSMGDHLRRLKIKLDQLQVDS